MAFRYKVVLDNISSSKLIELSGGTKHLVYLLDIMIYAGCSLYHPRFASSGST